MAVVDPTPDFGTGVRKTVAWSGMVTGDTINEFQLPEGGHWNLEVNGTFGGATVKLLASMPSVANNPASPTKGLPVDTTGTEWSATAAVGPLVVGPLAKGTRLKPSLTGGSGNSINLYLTKAD